MLIKSPAELIRRLNELRQQNPRAYTRIRTSSEIDQDDREENQPLPGDPKDD